MLIRVLGVELTKKNAAILAREYLGVFLSLATSDSRATILSMSNALVFIKASILERVLLEVDAVEGLGEPARYIDQVVSNIILRRRT